jgi:hypothetical protein
MIPVRPSEGVIAENLRHEQRKIIKYNHLVANLVILHNVVDEPGAEATPSRRGCDQPGSLGRSGAIPA